MYLLYILAVYLYSEVIYDMFNTSRMSGREQNFSRYNKVFVCE